MINRIEADNGSLVIRSYPTWIAGFCLIVLAAVVVQTVRGELAWIDAAIPTFVVVVAMSVLEYKVATFRRGDAHVLVESIRPVHRAQTQIPLDQIRSVNRSTGRGGHSHAGVVQLRTAEDEISVTSVAAFSPRKQVVALQAIRGFLSGSV
ncbi:hypothetical protein SAMN06265222_11789 [Neorhodopirellula lusitana]|uniref:DUF304 domain-containing protein n=1 Tax=Neorhodopirellula lusitana TaxID=445327 RepID=A0ABY1QKP8_9BACT|nr:hypothetical protein [Neorhodopirellula lusitana]SMP74255.1 hypothetical protein SAMN06265222_11789 [Neorhodopirellula lusitana]